ncbi:hypothetical protein DRO56_00980 [Candidatus Bathyarchaeota archaeon]|nr:MAG: hypothetical protein DRO56_00980 [Candidatus Bathyarchaeota archaeon]
MTGFVPIAAILIFWAVVPESLRYLGERGRRSEAISILREKGFIAPGEERVLELTGSKKAKVTIAELWSPGYRKRTAMLWIHWFCIVLTYWGIFLWAPYILEADRGISLVRTIKYTLLMTTMQIPGYWSGAFLIERVGRKRLLALYMALAGVGSLLFSVASTDLEALLWGSVISFFNLGAWGITYAYTPELYPTYMRGTGAGWANSVGRVGGILGPIIVGFLLKISGSKYLIFLLFALLHFLSSTDVLALGVETKGRPLE